MQLQGREVSPTRASLLALRDEQKLIQEGYEFLDEKRMLLAQEILKRLSELSALNARRADLQAKALDALILAHMRHGLEELTVYPPPFGSAFGLDVAQEQFLGLALVDARLEGLRAEVAERATFPSLESERCAEIFRDLLTLDAERASAQTNLTRLIQEYTTTERRARALENVLLPETSAAVKSIDEYIEAAEQEETLQIRHVKTRK